MNTINARITARRDTTANWNLQLSFIPLRGEIIVYTDHHQVEDSQGNLINVPGLKIGDGSAYLIDLPFVGGDETSEIITELRQHTGNTTVHVTAENKTFWNNKLNCQVNSGNLILNRN